MMKLQIKMVCLLLGLWMAGPAIATEPAGERLPVTVTPGLEEFEGQGRKIGVEPIRFKPRTQHILLCATAAVPGFGDLRQVVDELFRLLDDFDCPTCIPNFVVSKSH